MKQSRFTMFQGNALAILQTLPSNSVDAVLADPPYSSGAATLTAKQAHPANKYSSGRNRFDFPELLGDGKDQRSFTHWATLWLAECWRVAKPQAVVMVFTDWRQLPSVTDALQAAGWHWGGVVVWDKVTSRPQAGRFRSQCEFVVWGSKGKLPQKGSALPGVYSYTSRVSERYHLTSKPVELLKNLLAITPEGCTVLDPFLGGGSTALAALETGRSCIGIELSPEYVQIAAERIKTLALVSFDM